MPLPEASICGKTPGIGPREVASEAISAFVTSFLSQLKGEIARKRLFQEMAVDS
jgi:hypothetical protein